MTTVPALPVSRTRAVRLGPWSVAALAVASVLGLIAFAWPFLLRPEPGTGAGSGAYATGATGEAPLLFALLLLLVLAVLLAQVAEGGLDAKALALLGVLAAVGAVLRPLGAGTAGLETVFFLLVLGGRVLGPGFGFVLGSTTLFASALLTGGVGPWLPFQMFASAWIGLGAGLLPPVRGKPEVLLLAGYGAVAAFAYGFLLNLSFWPFTLGGGTALSFDPALSPLANLHRYVLFDVATSLGWDTGRALTNAVLIAVTAPAVLAALRRAARRAAFGAPVRFEEPVG